MRQNLLVSSRGQITLPSLVRKRLGIKSGGVVTLEEKDNVVVLRPAAVVEIETYSDGILPSGTKKTVLNLLSGMAF